MYRFLADQNFPGPSISLLRRAGHDVVSVTEDAPGSPDPVVLAWAVREERILLTSDRDYGDLIFRKGLPAPPGVIYFRLDTRDPEVRGLIALALADDPVFEIDRMYTTVGERHTRQRPLR